VKQLPQVAADADRMLTEWSAVPVGREFVEDRIEALAARRDDLNNGIADLDRQIAEIASATATSATVCEALRRVDEVYEHLRPHERKGAVQAAAAERRGGRAADHAGDLCRCAVAGWARC